VELLFPCKKLASFLALTWKTGLIIFVKKITSQSINLSFSPKPYRRKVDKEWAKNTGISGLLKAVNTNCCQTIKGAIKGEKQGRLDDRL
jgi:hypothetical protein